MSYLTTYYVFKKTIVKENSTLYVTVYVLSSSNLIKSEFNINNVTLIIIILYVLWTEVVCVACLCVFRCFPDS